MRRIRTAVALLAAASLLTLAACSTASPSPDADGGGGSEATTVNVTLQEWAVVVDTESVPAGEVTFQITNDGPEDVHEFVILKTDLAPGDLPTDEHGAVSEEGEGMEVVDEVEDLEVGASEDLTVTLEAGSYILLCNIYDEDEGEAHFAEGMRTPFTVE